MPEYVGRFSGTNAEAKEINPDSSSAASAHHSTSTRWSVLSERIQGLLLEATAVGVGMEEYCMDMSGLEGAAMRAVREKMMKTDWKKEWEAGRTMFAYGEEMSTDPLEAQMIKAMTTMKQPRRILEIGMFTGYGAAAMLEGCPSARVVSLEIDPFLKGWVEECLAAADASGGSDTAARLNIVTGPALDTLQDLPPSEKFDLVFVDANKSEYRRYIEILLELDLLADRAQIIADNTLYCGIPYTDPLLDSQPARRAFGDAIRDFNQWVKDHPSLQQVILPMRDGVSIIMHTPSL